MSHLALVIPTLDRIGGAEQQTILLAQGLRARGWQVTVVALSGSGGASATALRSQQIAFLTLNMRKGLADPRGWLKFHRWLRSNRPDILHAHLPHAAWFARWSRLFAPVRLQIDTLHSSSTGSWGRRFGYRISRCLTDQVTAVSLAIADSHCAARMVAPTSLSILPNGIDTIKFQPDPKNRASLRHELGIGDGFVWLAAGRLDRVKNYPTLLRAFAGLHPPSQLVIAGAGPLQPELQRLAGELGLNNRVRFLGFQPDVSRWMKAADAFVLSSLWEGLPIALLEACACALPAVATDVPGTREAIHPDQAGFLAAPDNPLALHEAMLRLMELPLPERHSIGARSRLFVQQKFSLPAVLNQWEALYSSLLAQSPLPSRRRQKRFPI